MTQPDYVYVTIIAAATDKVWEGAEDLEWTVPSPAPYHTFETAPQVK